MKLTKEDLIKEITILIYAIQTLGVDVGKINFEGFQKYDYKLLVDVRDEWNTRFETERMKERMKLLLK